MSLSRLALRLAAIEALCPSLSAIEGPWPTIAGNRVYDSRMDLIEGDQATLAEIEGNPIAIVYTERDETQPYGEIKYPAQERICHLTVELLIAATGMVEVDNADGTKTTVGSISAPITDRQHEALLDLLEGQVIQLLGRRVGEEMPSSAALYNKVAMECRHIASVPQRDADRAIRYAARTLTLTLKIKADSWPQNLNAGQSAPSGLGLLPDLLQMVANGLDPSSTGYALCQSMVGLMGVPVERTQLTDIRAFLGVTPHAVPTQSDGSDSDIQADIPEGT